MFRRKARPNTDPHAEELRAMFVANRERVQSWPVNWDFPEVAWPEVSAIPSPYGVLPGQEQTWFEHHAPYMPQYWWLLEPRPLTPSISQVDCCWWFRENHEFDRLTMNTRTVADPAYLAERLTLGVDAANLKGWHADDAHAVYQWMHELLDERPMEHGVRQGRRCGFVFVEVSRYPYSRTEIEVQTIVTVVNATLDGTPLDDTGRPVR